MYNHSMEQGFVYLLVSIGCHLVMQSQDLSRHWFELLVYTKELHNLLIHTTPYCSLISNAVC